MYFLTLSLLVMRAAQALLVPAPPGPYSVAAKDFELIDINRNDPLAPKPNTKRKLMATAYLPIDSRYHCQTHIVPYMPTLTASVFGQVGETLGIAQGTLEKFEMEFCDISSISSRRGYGEKKRFPLTIFSPGRGGTRLVYSALARSLASLGYIVVTLDHTYETAVVEFLDGSVAYARDVPDVNQTVYEQEVEIRTRDVSFLISQLSNSTLTDFVFASFPGTFDPHHVAVYGHSLGGATAATTAQRDARVVGGINFDGTIWGAVTKQAFHGKPFLLVASPDNLTDDDHVLEWQEFYDKLNSAKLELAVKNTQHYAFLDVPLLLSVDPVPSAAQPAVQEYFGTLSGRRVEKAVNDIVVGLLELLFYKNLRQLENLSKDVDLTIVESDLPSCD